MPLYSGRWPSRVTACQLICLHSIPFPAAALAVDAKNETNNIGQQSQRCR